MSNTMAATTHEPINYLDSILNEEEKRCGYSHQWRNFTISRSGRFKSKNKKRDIVDGKLFDPNAVNNNNNNTKDINHQKHNHHQQQQQQHHHHQREQHEKISTRQNANTTYAYKSFQTPTTMASGGMSSTRNQRDKTETYKSFYETNL